MSERLTDNPSLFRLRVRYGKRDRLKYLGHLEVIHTIERIVRRAGLPYAVTQGFSPHMRVGFSSALPVGTSSTCEWYDLFMTEFVALDEAFGRLAAASPADLAPIEAAYIDVRTPALTAQLTRLSYRIDLHLDPEAPVSADEVRRAIDTLRAGHGIDYARGKKSKRLDLDHTLVGYELTAGERPDHLVLMLDTHADNEGSMRPEILLSAADVLLQGLTPGVVPFCQIRRCRSPRRTGMQDLVTICSYDVERQNQACEDDEGRLVSPIPVRTCGFAPHTR